MDLITTPLPAAATEGRFGSVAPSPSSDGTPQEFLNRDLSWLEFNRRVLHEALDERLLLIHGDRFHGQNSHDIAL